MPQAALSVGRQGAVDALHEKRALSEGSNGPAAVLPVPMEAQADSHSAAETGTPPAERQRKLRMRIGSDSPNAALGHPNARVPGTKDQTTDGVTSLGAELSSLKRIREVSMEWGVLDALDELDRHERRFPTPGLGIEATVLRIDLLWRAGKKSAARALGESFLRDHPDCPHAQHVRTLLGLDSGRPAPLRPRALVEEGTK